MTQTKIREEFGQGRMVGTREAVARGMADRIATLYQVIGGMLQQRASRPSSPRRPALGPIDIHCIQIIAAARWMKPVKLSDRLS
ncbi:hypothetical protein [Bradyrhizobium australafricanum]|uniref:hypothetical protein n=1 Tax=Bradyrhizobium australafricanum TaxID=2821406 RepID=UPI001CE26B73|nr:hypothetical protein [Bradyrhizobium australafricanum]MCA6105526.1 hypothetical protein [Bradyrhizobium australafricanum]